MARTAKINWVVGDCPAIILVKPQLGENIGATARAMLNCGLTDLRLVQPRDTWPNPQAYAAASGADDILVSARLYETTELAISSLQVVYATTARQRDMVKPVIKPQDAARCMKEAIAVGTTVGVLFGAERSGLNNDDVTLSDAIINISLNPSFNSLNLAQAVLVVCYEWFMATPFATGELSDLDSENWRVPGKTEPVNKADLLYFLTRLEGELDSCGFLQPREQRPTMVRTIRNIFQRARLTDQDVRTLHGIVSGLTRKHER